MATNHLGPWESITVDDAAELFHAASFRWWLAGGHALDAYLAATGQSPVGRQHDDTDIGICTSDAPALLDLLGGWDLHVAFDGVLTPWDGDVASLTIGAQAVTNLWCRRTPTSPWALDLLLGDGDHNQWIYRPDMSVRRSWDDVILDGTPPYLAPEVQLLFKSRRVRPKDAVDAEFVIPRLEPARRSWLAGHLTPDHPWQTTIAKARAQLATSQGPNSEADVGLIASGRSSQAWRAASEGEVVRVPIPNSGRLSSYRSEALICDLLADQGHPVSRWRIETVDDVECSTGTILEGSTVGTDQRWSDEFVEQLGSALRDLHSLPATGWGPLSNRSDELRGMSGNATAGIIDRWFHASIWPFDGTELTAHPVAESNPDLLPRLESLRTPILEAARAPFGVVHSDLHREHLLQVDERLSGLLDFGDAFIGSTAWDIALIDWYYGAANARGVAALCGEAEDLAERGALLAVAVACYKLAKSPDQVDLGGRLRSLLDRLLPEDPTVRQRVGVVIVADERIAMIERRRSGARYFVIPGGGMKPGETIEHTACREALEELGVEIEVGAALARIRLTQAESPEGQTTGLQYYVEARVVGGTFGSGQGPEFSAPPEQGTYTPRWLLLADSDHLDVRPRALLDALRNHGIDTLRSAPLLIAETM